MSSEMYDIGVIGLGVMGRNLALNISDHGFSVAGYNRHFDKTLEWEKAAGGKPVFASKSVEELVNGLKHPRTIILMVPAGKPVDEVISELEPLLARGDLIIDGGNSHYKDTDGRIKYLQKEEIHFMGVGISGGEKGARFGPSIMPGGRKEDYERIRPVFEAISAHVEGDPCVAYLGSGSAGHYVKMVHNGIEYGLMQLISEVYDLLRRGLQLGNNEIADIFLHWNKGELQSFLIEITSEIFRRPDDKTGGRLIDKILDEARQKGTGKWASQDAMDLQVPIPTIDAAVSFRDLSGYKEQREEASKQLCGPVPNFMGEKDSFIEELGHALHCGMIITFAQATALLKKASDDYNYDLQLNEVVRIWRGGCIIRAGLLEEIRSALKRRPELQNLILGAELSKILVTKQQYLRKTVQSAVSWGIPAPGMAACLSYFDGFRSDRLPANLIQAQRDFFGSHTYQRIDEQGSFHTEWEGA